MKKLNNIKYIVFLILIISLSFTLPLLWEVSTDKAIRYPFTYYSSIKNSFCYKTIDEKSTELKDMLGNVYTEKEFDSILPMFYYRQLATDGRLPDSLHNVEISIQKIRQHSFYFNYRPRDKFSPHIDLFPLFESMSGKVNIEMPGDVFRMTKERIEFIDPETNQVKIDKSNSFSKLFSQFGYKGPARIVAGNPSTRKAYDEGYLIVDQNNGLFHLKMVNAKPFIKKIDVPSGIDICHISTTEFADKRFYGFLYDKLGEVYFISTDNYKLIKVPTPEFSYQTDRLLIMGNMFYWTIVNTSERGQDIYAVDASTMELVDSTRYEKDHYLSEKISTYIFPFVLEFKSTNSRFVKPNFTGISLNFIWLNILLIIIYVVVHRREKYLFSLPLLIGILLTGIYGFLSALFINIKK